MSVQKKYRQLAHVIAWENLPPADLYQRELLIDLMFGLELRGL